MDDGFPTAGNQVLKCGSCRLKESKVEGDFRDEVVEGEFHVGYRRRLFVGN